jgi:hypothetical protein
MYMYNPTCWNKTEKTSWIVHIHPLLEQDWENKLDCTYTSTAGTRLLLVHDWENKLDCTHTSTAGTRLQQWIYMYSPTCFLSLVPAVDVYVQSNLFSQSCTSSGRTVHIHLLLEQDWENKLDCTYTSTAGTWLRKQVGLYIYIHCWNKTEKTSWTVHIHPLLEQDWENKLCTVQLVFSVMYQQ